MFFNQVAIANEENIYKLSYLQNYIFTKHLNVTTNGDRAKRKGKKNLIGLFEMRLAETRK